MRTLRSLAGVLTPWIAVALAGGLVWLLVAYVAEGTDLRSRYEVVWIKTYLGWANWFWILVWSSVGAVLGWRWSHPRRSYRRLDRLGATRRDWLRAAWSVPRLRAEDEPRGFDERGAVALVVASGLVALFSAVMLFRGRAWDLDKDEARYYDQDTVFVVPDLGGIPVSLDAIVNRGATESRDAGGELISIGGRHDVTSTIIEGQLPAEGWIERGAPAEAARQFMAESSGGRQATEVLTNSLAYIYDVTSDSDATDATDATDASDAERVTGNWTMIRDGSNIDAPLESIVYWDGVSPRASDCVFEGDHEINRALRGRRDNSLRNLISQGERRHLTYHLDDAYGYCDGDEPVVVLPMRQLVASGSSVIEAFAGALLITGSPSGEPQLDLVDNIEPGEIPGPVYPISLAARQRELHTLLAGRENRNRLDFGFDTAAVGTQEGNRSEFNLYSVADGRTYWVTPMTLRGTSSQIIVAYAVVASDEASAGELNQLRIYVVDDDDPSSVVINAFERTVTDIVQRQLPGYIPSGGIVQEFIPGEDGRWSAFGVREGQPNFRLRVDPATGRGELIELAFAADQALDEVAGTDGGSSAAIPGDLDLADLSGQELIDLIRAALDELDRREQAEP